MDLRAGNHGFADEDGEYTGLDEGLDLDEDEELEVAETESEEDEELL